MLCADRVEALVRDSGWVLDYLDDLESDFSVLHRCDDMYALPGPKFLRLAQRTVAYAGVMQARAQGLMDGEQASTTPDPGYTPSGAPAASERVLPNGDRVREIAPTREALMSSPLAGLIEMGG